MNTGLLALASASASEPTAAADAAAAGAGASGSMGGIVHAPACTSSGSARTTVRRSVAATR